MKFIEYNLTSEFLCIGERVKGGVVKPCAKTIRYSQVSGALRRRFGVEDLNTIHAVGYLVEDREHNKSNFLIYSPRDRALELSKIPLQVEYMSDVLGKVFLLENDFTRNLPDEIVIQMGGLISKGFGRCRLRKTGTHEVTEKDKDIGSLKARIPCKYLDIFGIKIRDNKPVYGYLFEPTSPTTGVYIKALFEGSKVRAPKFLINKEKHYG